MRIRPFERGHRGWVYYLAVDPDHRGSGRGAALMAEVEKRLIALGCPKVQLQVRPGNEEALRFYDALGYTPFSASSTGKRLILDD
jgi:ribosomal protein S18 acetylase RimI-like enzyme